MNVSTRFSTEASASNLILVIFGSCTSSEFRLAESTPDQSAAMTIRGLKDPIKDGQFEASWRITRDFGKLCNLEMLSPGLLTANTLYPLKLR